MMLTIKPQANRLFRTSPLTFSFFSSQVSSSSSSSSSSCPSSSAAASSPSSFSLSWMKSRLILRSSSGLSAVHSTVFRRFLSNANALSALSSSPPRCSSFPTVAKTESSSPSSSSSGVAPTSSSTTADPDVPLLPPTLINRALSPHLYYYPLSMLDPPPVVWEPSIGWIGAGLFLFSLGYGAWAIYKEKEKAERDAQNVRRVEEDARRKRHERIRQELLLEREHREEEEERIDPPPSMLHTAT